MGGGYGDASDRLLYAGTQLRIHKQTYMLISCCKGAEDEEYQDADDKEKDQLADDSADNQPTTFVDSVVAVKFNSPSASAIQSRQSSRPSSRAVSVVPSGKPKFVVWSVTSI